jgi:hypothetical protein
MNDNTSQSKQDISRNDLVASSSTDIRARFIQENENNFENRDQNGVLKSKRNSYRSIRGSNMSIEKPIISLYPRKSISVASKDGSNSRLSMSQNINGSRPDGMNRPVSILSLKRLNMQRSQALVGGDADRIEHNPIHQEYAEYLMLQNRHSSSNYIQQINSEEIIWESKQSIVKMLGPHLLGGRIGKGAFGKVKEGICSDTLQRIAIKIVAKKRVKKMANSIIQY